MSTDVSYDTLQFTRVIIFALPRLEREATQK